MGIPLDEDEDDDDYVDEDDDDASEYGRARSPMRVKAEKKQPAYREAQAKKRAREFQFMADYIVSYGAHWDELRTQDRWSAFQQQVTQCPAPPSISIRLRLSYSMRIGHLEPGPRNTAHTKRVSMHCAISDI